ncbi:neuronal acetylcholine receptor subunit beta-4-like [Agrilus planipennis]|uniref:Neuronal acetylcholine receptor subunit beta-4-like n=1 Tax=Agrilus planipennis TaxID=224129 RepID=A0A7F5R742_AGRPL|nr:neuronal acetylcholine receptor subunit beta-4-like [Agrilus planipennis]
MVDFANQNYSNPKLSFLQMNISCENLPIDFENQFDHIFSFYCLHWVQNQSVDSSYKESIVYPLATVDNTGRVVMMNGGIFSSFCKIDVSYFPFDVQTCTLNWASWTYTIDKVDLILEENEISTFSPEDNGEFDLLSFSSRKSIFITATYKRSIPYIQCVYSSFAYLAVQMKK